MKTDTPGDYHIGSGDVLQIDVWKEPDASTPAVTVRPDGKISARMVGEIPVVGLAPIEIETLLATKYSDFIRNPRVSVVVREMNSQKVYVIGEVKKEGAIQLHGPLTVLQALAEAGGLSDYAKRKKINILRLGQPSRNMLRFDYDQVIRGDHMEQNVVLLPGDTIIVPR